MPHDIKILVCCGLPGSGKTTFACQTATGKHPEPYHHLGRFLWNNGKTKTVVANFDYAMRNSNKTKPIEGLYLELFNEIQLHIRGLSGWTVILDGLFLTHVDYVRIAKAFRDYHIIYHWWTPLRDVCERNDRYRRSENSNDLIMKAKFEEPEPVALKLASACTGEIETVMHKPKPKLAYQLFCDKYKLGNTIESDSWSNGGTHNDCYGHTYTSGPSAALASFVEFDELIEKIDEGISFMRYKKIYNACVETETYNDAGYYGGSATSSKYICYTQTLYNKLIEMDIMPEEFI